MPRSGFPTALAAARPGSRTAPWLVLVAALVCIGLQFGGDLSASVLALVLWLLVLALVDRRALRKLWMPRFWLFSLLLALVSGFLLGGNLSKAHGLTLSRVGLDAGLLMIVRGAFLLSLAAHLSAKVKSARFQRLLSRLGFSGFGTALATASALLPELSHTLQARTGVWKAQAPTWRGRLTHFPDLAVQALVETAALAEQCARLGSDRTQVAELLVFIEGPPQSGKTRCLLALVAALKEAGHSVGGIAQPAVHQSDERVGYRLLDVESGETSTFAERVNPSAPAAAGRRYQFEPTAFTRSRDLLKRAVLEHPIVCVDELGRLEARGQGHLPGLQQALLQKQPRVLLATVRADAAPALMLLLGRPTVTLAPTADAAELGELLTLIAQVATRLSAPKSDTGARAISEECR